MTLTKRILPFLVLPFLGVACGEDGGGGEAGNIVRADPAYFAAGFDCDDTTPLPSCPPGICDVDVNGEVSNCLEGCNVSGQFEDCTAFQFTGAAGLDLCVPRQCTVGFDGEVTCDEECAEDDVTCYVFAGERCPQS